MNISRRGKKQQGSKGAREQGGKGEWLVSPRFPGPEYEFPDQPTPFIGRRAELTELAKRLADPACRLLTLIGPGGIGKTRLALETAARASSGEAFPDGVHFIPLTRVSRAEFLVSAIGHALKLSFYSPEGFDENPKAQLFNYLHQRKMLLVLDNFEHLLVPPLSPPQGGKEGGVPGEIAFALNYQGTVAHLQGDYGRARQLWQESLALYRQLGDRWGMAWSLSVLGHLLGELGEYLAARQYLQESLAIQQEIGNRRGLAGALNNLGHVLYLLGEYAEARVLLQESLAIRRELGFRRGIAISLNHLGDVTLALGDIAASKQSFYEALKTALDLSKMPSGVRATPLALESLVGLATCLTEEGKSKPAFELLRFPLYHAASGQETRDKAQHLLAQLEPHLPPGLSTMRQAVPGGEARDFETTVQMLLVEDASRGSEGRRSDRGEG